MSLRDHIRRWLHHYRDEPLTLTDEQREMVARAIHRIETGDLTHSIFEWSPADDGSHGEVRFNLDVDTTGLGRDWQRAPARGGIVHSDATADTPPWFRSWDHIDPWIYQQHQAQQAAARLRDRLAAILGDEPGIDAAPRDPRPDYCWRCDALPATHPIIGLCGKCTTDLKAGD